MHSKIRVKYRISDINRFLEVPLINSTVFIQTTWLRIKNKKKEFYVKFALKHDFDFQGTMSQNWER